MRARSGDGPPAAGAPPVDRRHERRRRRRSPSCCGARAAARVPRRRRASGERTAPRLPLQALAERLARARARSRRAGARGCARRARRACSAACAMRGRSDRAPLLRRAHALLPALRAASTAQPATAGDEYRADAAARSRRRSPRSGSRSQSLRARRTEARRRAGALRPRDRRGPPLSSAVPLRGPAHAGRRCGALASRRGGDGGRRGRRRAAEARRPRAAAVSSRSSCATATASAVLVWFNQVAVLRDALPRRASGCSCTAGSRPPLGVRAAAASSIPTSRCSAPTRSSTRAPRSSRSTRSRRRCPSASCGGSCRARSTRYADRVPSALPPEIARAAAPGRPRRARSATCTRRRRRPISPRSASAPLARASLADLRRALLPPARPGAPAERGGRGARHRVPGRRRVSSPALRAALPFALTGAQERAIARDRAPTSAAPHPMRRLLQGDVGSGKTLVALLAALVVIEAGWQVGAHGADRAARRAALRDRARRCWRRSASRPRSSPAAVKGRARRARRWPGSRAARVGLAVGHARAHPGGRASSRASGSRSSTSSIASASCSGRRCSAAADSRAPSTCS